MTLKLYMVLVSWFTKYPDKQRGLVNSFAIDYNFFDHKKQQHTNNKTLDEYIIDTISDKYDTHSNDRYRANINEQGYYHCMELF